MVNNETQSESSTAVGIADDAELMAGIARRDPSSLTRFYDLHSPLVFAFCLRSLKSASDAEDVTLEVFWELWRSYARFDPSRSSPRTYLLNLTRSRIIDRVRSRQRYLRHEQLDASPEPSPDRSQSVASDLLKDEERQRVIRAVQSLPPDQRMAVELAFFDAMSHSQIAAHLGKPLGTIKTRIRQAMERLRETLSGMKP